MKYTDYYAALGVPRDADLAAIKKAYRTLARKFHPDVSKSPGTEAKFKEAAEAYATLKNPEKRAAYDELGERPDGAEFAPPPRWSEAHAPPQDSGHGPGGAAFEDMDLADLLAALGRGPRGGARAPMTGRDHDSRVSLALEDAHRGTTLNLELSDEDGRHVLEVRIPAGVTEGQKLRLRGKGGKGRNGGADGDIYLHIALAPHAVFRPDGHDLHFDLALAPWEAVLGAEPAVPTLDGPVLLSVPPDTRAGRKLRLRGRGLADGKGGHGNLVAHVRIDVPATLGERERELFQELARESRFDARAPLSKESP